MIKIIVQIGLIQISTSNCVSQTTPLTVPPPTMDTILGLMNLFTKIINNVNQLSSLSYLKIRSRDQQSSKVPKNSGPNKHAQVPFEKETSSRKFESLCLKKNTQKNNLNKIYKLPLLKNGANAKMKTVSIEPVSLIKFPKLILLLIKQYYESKNQKNAGAFNNYECYLHFKYIVTYHIKKDVLKQ